MADRRLRDRAVIAAVGCAMWGRQRGLRLVGMVVLLLVLCSTGARANGGPPRRLGDLGGVVVPDESTPVRVLGEELALEVRKGLGEADVTATYQLLHPGGEPVELPVAFVTRETGSGPRGPRITVELDGKPLDVEQLSLADMFRGHVEERLQAEVGLAAILEGLAGKNSFDESDWRALGSALEDAGFPGVSRSEGASLVEYARYRCSRGVSGVPYGAVVAVARILFPAEVGQVERGWRGPIIPYLDPVDGREYEGEFHGGEGELWFTNFRVRLEPETPANLTVRHRHTAAVDRERRRTPIYHYQYVLHPARAWAGFGGLRVRVHLPETVHLASSLPLKRVGAERGVVYAAEFAGLPEGNLSVALMLRFRLQDRPGIIAAAVLLVGAGVAVCLRAAGAARRRHSARRDPQAGGSSGR